MYRLLPEGLCRDVCLSSVCIRGRVAIAAALCKSALFKNMDGSIF